MSILYNPLIAVEFVVFLPKAMDNCIVCSLIQLSVKKLQHDNIIVISMRIKNTILLFFILFIFSAIAISASAAEKLVSVKDENNDGVPDVWFYQVDNKTISMEQDFDFDGSPDTCESLNREEKRKIQKTDFGCDGSIETWTITTDQEKWVYIDLNSDNIPDLYGYYKNTIKVKFQSDLDFDGKYDASEYYINVIFSHCDIDIDHDGIADQKFDKVHDLDKWIEVNYSDFVDLQRKFFSRHDYAR